MAKIVSMPDGVAFEAQAGETLLEAALRSGVPLAHACGGRAKCSTCRVWVLEGRAACPARSEPENAMAERLGLSEEVRLACQLKPESDLRVRRLVLDEIDLAISSQLDRQSATRAGEIRDITVFFSDVADFTAISETLLPYDVMYLLNRYFVQAGDIIERNGGYIDKFVGDGLMAVFGSDGEPDAPIQAVNAALQTLAAIDRMKPFVAAMYDIDFDLRVGLHYGEAVLGSVGSRGHERLTAIGDVVNVASRIEAANKEAGTRFLISAALHEKVKEQVEVLDFVRTRLRGTTERITLYEIRRLKPEVEAALNARSVQEREQHAGREWLRVLPADELAVGERRIVDLEKCDVVIYRNADGYVAFNNACPHMRLPFYDRRMPTKDETTQMPQGSSELTGDLGVVCRWHGTCYDLLTGDIREWCPYLDAEGISPTMPFLGDISKNKTPLEVFSCRVSDGQLWVSLD